MIKFNNINSFIKLIVLNSLHYIRKQCGTCINEVQSQELYNTFINEVQLQKLPYIMIPCIIRHCKLYIVTIIVIVIALIV